MEMTSNNPKEITAQYLWTGFILMFFVIQALIWTFAISITSSDPSHVVVEGYDRQALTWDQVKQERANSLALGWSIDVDIESNSDVLGNRALGVTAKDAHGQPIENGELELRAFHQGRAADSQVIKLFKSKPGVYNGQVQVRHAGIWRLEGELTLGDKRFLVNETRRLALPGGQ